jgi:hypothetical protein
VIARGPETQAHEPESAKTTPFSGR